MNSHFFSTLRKAAIVGVFALVATGCSKASKPDEMAPPTPTAKPVGASIEAATDAAPPPPPPGPTPTAVAADGAAPVADSGEVPPSLQQVRDALVQWTFQNNNPPKDLNDLVKQGYLKRLPVPPPGKKFVLDPRMMTVTLGD